MVISVKGPFFLKSKISTAFTLPPFFNVVIFVLNKTPKFERRNLPAKIKLCFLSSGNHNFYYRARRLQSCSNLGAGL